MTPGTHGAFCRLVLLLLFFLSLISSGDGTVCAGLTYYSANTSSQTFTSPDYPSNYGINIYCSWLLEASDSSHFVRLSIDNSSLENADGSGSCSYDYGRAYDGSDMTTLLGDWCGTTTTTLTSTGTKMLIVFRSDYSTVSTGFSASFWSGTFPVVTSAKDYTVVIACSVSGFVLIVGIIIFCCVRSKLKGSKRKSPAPDKQPLPDNGDLEANEEQRYAQGGKALFSQRIIPSSKGKRRQTLEAAVEPENTAVSRVTAINAATAAAAKEKEEKEREREEKKREKERKVAEEKAAKIEQKAKAAEEKRLAAEERKIAAEKAAEEKRVVAEERKLAAEKAAEEKRVAAEKAAEERRKTAEEKKIAAQKAAEEKKEMAVKAAEEKKAATEKAAKEKAEVEQKAVEEKNQPQSKGTDETKAGNGEKLPAGDKPAEKVTASREVAKISTPDDKTVAAAAVVIAGTNKTTEKARPTTKQGVKKKVAFDEKPKEIELPEPELAPAVADAASGNSPTPENVILVKGMVITQQPKSAEKKASQVGDQKKLLEESKDTANKEEPKPKEIQQKSNPEQKITKEKSNVDKTSSNKEAAKVGTTPVPDKQKPEVKSSAKLKEPSTKDTVKEEKTQSKPNTPKPGQARETSKPTTPKAKERPKPGKAEPKEASKTPRPVSREPSKVVPVVMAVTASSKPDDSKPKDKAKTEEKTKAAKPATKETPKRGSTPAKDASRPKTEEEKKTKTVPLGNSNSKPDTPKTDKGSKVEKPAEKPVSTSKPERPPSEQLQAPPQSETKNSDVPEEKTAVAGIAFGNKPGQVTRPGSKVMLLPTVVMVESAEAKKRKKMEDQWDKLSAARQDQISVQGGDVTPRVVSAFNSTHKKYHPENTVGKGQADAKVKAQPDSKVNDESDTKVKDQSDTKGKRGGNETDGKRAQTSDSSASLEKDEGINMDYEGGDSGKSSPASRAATLSPRDNTVVTPSVVNPSIVTSLISGTAGHQPVPIEAPSTGDGDRPQESSPSRFSSPVDGSVEDIEKRLSMALQWPKAWTYKSQQFSEIDIKSELSMQRAKTSLVDSASIRTANPTAPRPPVKGAFMSEAEKSNEIKNAVISSLAKQQGSQPQKVVPRGRNLITR